MLSEPASRCTSELYRLSLSSLSLRARSRPWRNTGPVLAVSPFALSRNACCVFLSWVSRLTIRLSISFRADMALRHSSPARSCASKPAGAPPRIGSGCTVTVRDAEFLPAVTVTVYVPGTTRGPATTRKGFSSSSPAGDRSKVSRVGPA